MICVDEITTVAPVSQQILYFGICDELLACCDAQISHAVMSHATLERLQVRPLACLQSVGYSGLIPACLMASAHLLISF